MSWTMNAVGQSIVVWLHHHTEQADAPVFFPLLRLLYCIRQRQLLLEHHRQSVKSANERISKARAAAESETMEMVRVTGNAMDEWAVLLIKMLKQNRYDEKGLLSMIDSALQLVKASGVPEEKRVIGTCKV